MIRTQCVNSINTQYLMSYGKITIKEASCRDVSIEMMELMSCGNQSNRIITRHLTRIQGTMRNSGAAYPKMYMTWIDTVINEGSAIFRLFAILTHMLFDETLKYALFEGERPENIVAFTERLQDKLYDALLGRKADGSRYSTQEIDASRYQRAAEIVCSMQDYYVAN